MSILVFIPFFRSNVCKWKSQWFFYSAWRKLYRGSC